MKDYLYYPGCSVESSANSYDHSSRALAKAIDINLIELEDWNCCGATSYMSIRELRSFAISARNLALAEKTEIKDLVTVCSACYTVLAKTHAYLQENIGLKNKVNDGLSAVNLHYSGSIRVRHLLDVIVNDIGLDVVKEKTVHPLSNLKVASYYGCQLSRPNGTFDDPETPVTMDRLFTAAGAQAVDYPMRAKCCAGMLMTTDTDVAEDCCNTLLQCAVDAGADCIVTCCPLCQINLDAYQGKLNKRFNKQYEMPILYFTQLLGLAFGLEKKPLGFGKEITSAEKVLQLAVR